MKVRHDGKVWDVVKEITIDGEPGYDLAPAGTHLFYLSARASECKIIKPQVRKLKGDKHVLEFYCDGSLKIRRVRSPRRFPVTLDQIYDLGVRLQVFKNGRVPKALRAGRRR